MLLWIVITTVVIGGGLFLITKDSPEFAVGAVSLSDELYHRVLVSASMVGYADCGKNLKENLSFSGLVEGMKLTKALVLTEQDVRGYMGWFEQERSIYIAFTGASGSHPMTNATELYDVWPDCNCQVHTHINTASKLIFPEILAEVKRLQSLYPDASVKTTGHSFGATMANMVGMLLL